MLIRYGYEITLTCQQPTALVCLLSVHEERAADIRVPETLSHHNRRSAEPTVLTHPWFKKDSSACRCCLSPRRGGHPLVAIADLLNSLET